MDLDPLLTKIREHVHVVLNSTNSATRATHGEWLAEAFADLDDRLSHSGHLPSDWQPLTFVTSDNPVAGDAFDAVLPQRTHAEVAARRAARAIVDPDGTVDGVLTELNSFPTWSGLTRSDTDPVPDDGDVHGFLVVCADCRAQPGFQEALAAFDGTLTGTCGHVSVPVEPSTYEDPAVQRAIAETIARDDA